MGTKEPTSARQRPPNVSPGSTAVRRRILVVDDHPMTRAGLAGIINSQPDLEVLAEASTASEAIQMLVREKPDLVLTDMTMPGRGGIELIKDIQALDAQLPVLVVSMHEEEVYGERALRAGARGFLMKDAGAARILDAIRVVLGGQVFVSSQLSARLLDAMTGRRPRGSHSPIERLSDREFEVYQLIGRGLSTREIASELHLSPKTVDVHRGHIREKLGLKSLTSLMRHAVRWIETGQTEIQSAE